MDHIQIHEDKNHTTQIFVKTKKNYDLAIWSELIYKLHYATKNENF